MSDSRFSYAQYVYVRAVGTSFSLVSIVAQSACIGARDSISPLVGVCIQSLANVAGDWLLVGVMGWGVAGAAWATIAAQLLGMIYLCTKMSVLLASMQSQAEAMCPSVSKTTPPPRQRVITSTPGNEELGREGLVGCGVSRGQQHETPITPGMAWRA